MHVGEVSPARHKGTVTTNYYIYNHKDVNSIHITT